MQNRYIFRSAAAYEWSPGEHMLRQRHPVVNELVFMIEGHLRVRGEQDFDVTAGAGDVLIYPRMVLHDETADPLKPARVFWFSFEGACGNTLRVAHDRGHRMAALVRWLMDLQGDRSTEAVRMREQVLALLLAEFDYQTASSGSSSDPLVTRTRAWMTEHLDERITVDQLAAQRKLSKYHFIRLYRQLAGRTPMADLRALRIDTACHLLTTTDLPLKRIAAMAGFGDPYQFSKAFKKATGTSPRKFMTR